MDRGNTMIISLTGLIGSGKDTVADYLVDEYGFTRDAFASTVKDMLAVVFSWDREMLEGRTKIAREQRNQVDEWWANRLNLPEFTPRWAMQHIGTEVFREHFHDDIWIAALENRLRKHKGHIVITDARYPNELAMIKRLHGMTWHVERGENPEWYDYAVRYNAADEKSQLTMRMIASIDTNSNIFNRRIHSSEWQWIGFPFDNEIDNNGDIKGLYATVEDSIKNLELTLLASTSS